MTWVFLSDREHRNVSSSTLSTRPTELTDAGLLVRTQHDTIPPQVEYELTQSDRELCEHLEPVLEWTETHTN